MFFAEVKNEDMVDYEDEILKTLKKQVENITTSLPKKKIKL